MGLEGLAVKGVAVGVALKIAQDEFLVGDFLNVVGVEGDFSAAAGGVDDELWDGVAGGVTPEGTDQFDAFAGVGAEVGTARDEVALVEVIGAHPHHEEAVDEGLEDCGIVIDAFQEDGLVAERDSREGEAFAGFAEGVGTFVGVVDVKTDPNRAVFFEDFCEGGSDALGEKDRDAGTDANEFNVGDGAEFAEEVIEFAVGEQEGVAAAEEDVADFGVFADVLESRLEFGVEVVILGVGDEAAAGTVATVGGATVGNEKEDAVGVAVNDAVHRFGFFFANGVKAFFGGSLGLFGARDDLAADGVCGIGGIDEVEEVGCDCEGKFLVGEKATGALIRVEFEVLFQIPEGGEAVFELPLPVVPVGGGNMSPMALSGMPIF